MIVRQHRVDGVLREQVEDNGDGTGTLTLWDADGNLISTEAVDGLHIPTAAELNEPVIRERLLLLLDEAATATALLQAQRDTAAITIGGSYNQANLQTTLRALQSAVKEQARIQQEHIKRTVALARLVAGALDSTDDT